MDQATLDQIKAEIAALGDFTAAIAGAVNPTLLPFIVIGKAAAVAVPTLVDDVNQWLAGQPPTDDQNAALAAKIAALSKPEEL